MESERPALPTRQRRNNTSTMQNTGDTDETILKELWPQTNRDNYNKGRSEGNVYSTMPDRRSSSNEEHTYSEIKFVDNGSPKTDHKEYERTKLPKVRIRKWRLDGVVKRQLLSSSTDRKVGVFEDEVRSDHDSNCEDEDKSKHAAKDKSNRYGGWKDENKSKTKDMSTERNTSSQVQKASENGTAPKLKYILYIVATFLACMAFSFIVFNFFRAEVMANREFNRLIQHEIITNKEQLLLQHSKIQALSSRIRMKTVEFQKLSRRILSLEMNVCRLMKKLRERSSTDILLSV